MGTVTQDTGPPAGLPQAQSQDSQPKLNEEKPRGPDSPTKGGTSAVRSWPNPIKCLFGVSWPREIELPSKQPWLHCSKRLYFQPAAFFAEQLACAVFSFMIFFGFLVVIFWWSEFGLRMVARDNSDSTQREPISFVFDDEQLLGQLLLSLTLLSIQSANWAASSGRALWRMFMWSNYITRPGCQKGSTYCKSDKNGTLSFPSQVGFWWFFTELVGYASLGLHVLVFAWLFKNKHKCFTTAKIDRDEIAACKDVMPELDGCQVTLFIFFLVLVVLEFIATDIVAPVWNENLKGVSDGMSADTTMSSTDSASPQS